MLTALILWVYITAIAGAYGWLALAILRRLIQAGEEVRIETPVVLLLGVALVGTLASILSLFIPVSLTANLVVVLVVAPGIGLTWQGFRSWLERVGASARRANPAVWAGALLLAVAVLRYGSVTPTNFDTGFYHAQAIRWIESYRAVPGLGNLFGRLAFDSGWFLPQALFSFAFLGLRSFHLLNPWLCLVAGIWMLNGISNLLCGRRALSDFVRLGMLPPLIYFLVRDSASPGTDLPAAILVWVALTLALERVEEGGFRRLDVAGVVLSCLAFYAVTVKLAALPLLILPLCLLVREFRLRNGGRAVGILGLAALLIFAPWLTRNVILSGYLIYPLRRHKPVQCRLEGARSLHGQRGALDYELGAHPGHGQRAGAGHAFHRLVSYLAGQALTLVQINLCLFHRDDGFLYGISSASISAERSAGW